MYISILEGIILLIMVILLSFIVKGLSIIIRNVANDSNKPV